MACLQTILLTVKIQGYIRKQCVNETCIQIRSTHFKAEIYTQIFVTGILSTKKSGKQWENMACIQIRVYTEHIF